MYIDLFIRFCDYLLILRSAFIQLVVGLTSGKTAVNTGLCEGSSLGMSGAVLLIPYSFLLVWNTCVPYLIYLTPTHYIWCYSAIYIM
jgi:hypothetical protein